MNYSDIREFLEEETNWNNVSIIDTTESMNGYPRNIMPAVIGFKDYSEAESYRDYINLKLKDAFKDNKFIAEIISMNKKDGWQLYHRNNPMDKPFDLMEEYAKNNTIYSRYKKWEEFYDNDIEQCLDYWKERGSYDFFKWMEEMKEMYSEIESLSNDEFIYRTDDGRWNKLNIESMSCYDDGRLDVIGVIVYIL